MSWHNPNPPYRWKCERAEFWKLVDERDNGMQASLAFTSRSKGRCRFPSTSATLSLSVTYSQCKSHFLWNFLRVRTCLAKIMLEASASSMIQYPSVVFVEILFLRLFSQEWIFLIFPHLPGDLRMPLCTLYCGSFEWWGMNMSISDLNEVSLAVSCWFVCSRINSEVQYSSRSVRLCSGHMLVEAEGSCDSVGWFARQQQMKREGRGMNWNRENNLQACHCNLSTLSLQDDSEAALSWMNLNDRLSPFLPLKAKWKFCRDHLELKLCQAKLCWGTVWAKVHWGC